MRKRLLTIHTNRKDGIALSPELVDVLNVIAQRKDERPRLVQTSDGVTVYVKDWGELQ